MKKIYIASVALVAAALTSCIQEQSFNDVKLGENDVVFTFQGAAPTKAAEAPVRNSGVTLSLGNEDGGDLVLEETVVDLNAWSPATKGTPAYTENVGDLYKNDLNVYATEFGGDALFETMDEEIYEYKNKANVSTAGWRYHHSYDQNYWPAEGTVGFYLNMPATQPGVTMTSRTGGKFTFSYTSPETASAQKDILLAYRTLTKEEHNGYLPAGAPVLFHHALTGVKFRVDNTDSEVSKKGIKIQSITFKGLVTSGTCVVTPRKEKENNKETDYIDNRTGDYSSGDQTLTSGTVAWTPNTTTTKVLYQEYGSAFADYSKGDYTFPKSFETATDHNLNDNDASLTFWLIPQEVGLTTEAENLRDSLIIIYDINGSVGKEARIALHHTTWKAGELRTYSLKIKDVGVEIQDELNEGEKTNVSVTNTGNMDEFVRVHIVANWVDENNIPVVGYQKNSVWNEQTQFYEAPADDPFVEPWKLILYNDSDHSFSIAGTVFKAGSKNADNAGATGLYGRNGAFDDLPGANWDWWTMNDGYIYYTQPIGAGKTGSEATTPLFTKFKMAPIERIAYELENPMTGKRKQVKIHLEMDIMIQAIEVKEGQTWQQAWNATKN